MRKANRIAWIDWLKAILIYTVIIGHTSSSIAPIIYLFHMPLFFFISGILTNISKQRRLGLWNSIKALIYGIFVWNAIFIIVNAIFSLCFNISINPKIDASSITTSSIILRPLIGIILCNYSNNALPLLPQFWFVWTLILCKVCYFYISYIKKKYVFLIIAICICFTTINTSIHLMTSNYYFTRLVAALPYFIIGAIIKENRRYYMNYKINFLLFFSLLLFCFGAALYMRYYHSYFINLANYKFQPNYCIALIVSFLFTFMLIEFCKIFPQVRVINTISTGTFFILAVHRLLIILFQPYFLYDKTCIILSSIIMIICYILLMLLGNKAPILLGKIN